jgi:acetylornithine/succinyldiaminopimelate/putrescine aminotransferase
MIIPRIAKADVIAGTRAHLQPHRTATFARMGIDLVLGKREGYRVWDLSGRELFDLHLNGGTYNLGHRHPEIIGALVEGAAGVDIGNHHFPSPLRLALAKRLSALAPAPLPYVVFSSGGSEAVDVAIKSARRATGRRKVLAVESGYHGRTGLSGAAGDDSAARFFHSDDTTHFVKVPFNHLAAARRAFEQHDFACVLMETLPATYGFPLPADGYLPGINALCKKHGALYVADEVQTGLGRSGAVWAISRFGVQPDILVTAKGLSGGIYPIAATLLGERAGSWLKEDGWAHVSTFGGAELGCCVALKVLEITTRPATVRSAQKVATLLGDGLRAIARRQPHLLEVRQCGLIFGLKVDHAEGALHLMKALYDRGVWAIFSGFDMSVLQFKPGLLMSAAECREVLGIVEQALQAAAAMRGAPLMMKAAS